VILIKRGHHAGSARRLALRHEMGGTRRTARVSKGGEEGSERFRMFLSVHSVVALKSAHGVPCREMPLDILYEVSD
jgi:hypothetical protein